MSTVYFTNFRSSDKNPFKKRLKKILDMYDWDSKLKKNPIIGIKMHFGEYGTTHFVSHIYINMIIDFFKKYSEKIFLTDTNTIYTGSRVDAVTHLKTAYRHGFNFSSTGIPTIIADGLTGKDERDIEVNLKYYKTVKVGSAVTEVDLLIAVSHIKGHMLTGFGGALKNIGMGCASKSQKLAIHSTVSPFVKEESCTGCKLCSEHCPADAITFISKKAYIDSELCIGCAECIAVCPEKAIKIKWDEESSAVQNKYIEVVYGLKKALKNRLFFINFINNVTPDCDCFSFSDNPIVPNLGVVISEDPVSADKASVDIVNNSEGLKNSRLKSAFGKGEDKFKSLYPEVNWSVQLDYAQELGIGRKDYELKRIDG